MRLRQTRTENRRWGSSTVEFAVVLPFLAFTVVVAVDFARVFRHNQIVTNCARNGALYGSFDATHSLDADGIKKAALADAGNLTPTPDVSSTTGVDAAGDPYVQVTVTSQFQTVVNYPGIPTAVSIPRTVQMRVASLLPKNS